MEELKEKLGSLVADTMLSDKQTSHYTNSISEKSNGTFSQASDIISEISDFEAYMSTPTIQIEQRNSRPKAQTRFKWSLSERLRYALTSRYLTLSFCQFVTNPSNRNRKHACKERAPKVCRVQNSTQRLWENTEKANFRVPQNRKIGTWEKGNSFIHFWQFWASERGTFSYEA